MRKVSTSILILAVLIVVFGVILIWPGSHGVDSPFIREYSRIHEISVKLRYYADEHSTFPGGATTNANLEELTAAGVLSADDVRYLRDHQIEYRGFDLGSISADTPVFRAVFTNANPPRCIVSYSDGHTVWEKLRNKP